MKNHKSSCLGTIITVLIFLSLASYIWGKYRTSIIIAIVFLLIIAVVYAIYRLSANTGESSFSNSKTSNDVIKQEEKNKTIKAHMNILLESTELLNTSNILGTVVNRYRMCLNTIDSLSIYSNEEIEATGYKLKQSLAETKHFIQQNKVSLFNQAIKRNLTSEMDSLENADKKSQKIKLLYHKMKAEQLLEPENLSFLDDLYAKFSKEIKEAQQETQDSPQKVYIKETVYEDGSSTSTYFTEEDLFYEKFRDLSLAIENERDVTRKLRLCEESYLLLPRFVELCIRQDGDLPPCITCRDVGPGLYIKTGQWDNARAAFQKCISANAYYGEEITDITSNFNNLLCMAQRIVQYIQENPGTLQRDLYKNMNLNSDEKQDAIYFVRTAKILRKEPYKSTNKLFIKPYDQ